MTTDRLALPLIASGQAQKEMTHNEALALIDIALQASVVAVGIDTPPSAPAAGQCWIVGAAPTGAWAGKARAIAGWTDAGWRFVAARTGMTAAIAGGGRVARFDGTGWVSGVLVADRIDIDGVQVIGARQAAILSPTGGSVADSEARGAIASVLNALRAHGLIAPTS